MTKEEKFKKIAVLQKQIEELKMEPVDVKIEATEEHVGLLCEFYDKEANNEKSRHDGSKPMGELLGPLAGFVGKRPVSCLGDRLWDGATLYLGPVPVLMQEWGGKECPVEKSQKVIVRLANGKFMIQIAGELLWNLSCSESIVVYASLDLRELKGEKNG